MGQARQCLGGAVFWALNQIVVNVARFGITCRAALEVENRIRELVLKVQEIHGARVRVEF